MFEFAGFSCPRGIHAAIPKRVLAVLVATLCVAVPIKFYEAPDVFLASSDASGAARPDMVTIDLALLFDDGAAMTLTWIRVSGELDEVTSTVSADGQIWVEDLFMLWEVLMLWEVEVVSNDRIGSSTAASVASSIDAEMDGLAQHRPHEYELLTPRPWLSARGLAPSVVGRLSITRDSPRVYTGLGYIDLGLIMESYETGSPLSMEPAAASSSGVTSSLYLVWPEEASLGETVAILLETQSEVDLYPDGALLDTSVEKFNVQLTDESDGSSGSIQPRAVIEVPAALGSAIVGLEAESWAGIVLLFDLPDPWPPNETLADDTALTVRVDYEGNPVFDGKTLIIATGGGSPLPDPDFERLSDLEHRPMLRLRPSWDPTLAIGFDPTWVIGGLEFTLRYDGLLGGNIENVSARVNGDANRALVWVTKLQNELVWKIFVVDPEGFLIPDKGCYAGDCYAGRWSLLDLPVDTNDNGLSEGYPIFSEGDFVIEDLKVIDVDGVQLPIDSGETVFLKYAVNNLVDPAPQGGGGTAEHMIWPMQAYTGDTIAILFNTEGDVGFPPDAAPEALLEADIDNVMVMITDPDMYSELVGPSAVIELPAALGSKKVGSPPQSQTGVIAFFEFPDSWANPNPTYSLPADFEIAVEYYGAPTFGVNDIRIVGTGGVETDFAPVAALDSLALGPMLRLRPTWDAVNQEGFDPAWTIGSLEFTLRFNTLAAGGVNNLTVVGNGEATAALAMSTDLPREGSDKLWKISLVYPDGFTLPDKGCDAFNDCFSGRWSLLDFPLEKDETGVTLGEPVFIPDDFTVEALKVFNLNGNQLNPPFTEELFFHNYAVNAIAVPEPGTNLQLVFGALGLALLNWLRHRERQV